MAFFFFLDFFNQITFYFKLLGHLSRSSDQTFRLNLKWLHIMHIGHYIRGHAPFLCSLRGARIAGTRRSLERSLKKVFCFVFLNRDVWVQVKTKYVTQIIFRPHYAENDNDKELSQSKVRY